MVATVLPFHKRKPRKPLAKDLARRVRKMLRKGKMVVAHPRVKERLLSRGITAMQMLTTMDVATRLAVMRLRLSKNPGRDVWQ
jgi:hypothetical protein